MPDTPAPRSTLLARILSFPAGRRSKWIVLLVWLIAMSTTVVLQLPTKFADAEINETSSFLPSGTESTEVLEKVKRLRGDEFVPGVVVARRESGLTAADRKAIEQTRERLNEVEGKGVFPFDEPVFSKDGTTALLNNQITAEGESERLTTLVDDYRAAVKDQPDGLEVKVSGPLGISADAVKVFEGLNGTLLLAAGSLVIFLLIAIYRSPVFWLVPTFAILCGELTARALGYSVTELGATVNGQSSSIMSVLVLGAGTDYALLLVSRYREELRHHEDRHEAMRLALTNGGPAIIASALTVAVALFSLLLADVNGTAGLGPIGALGILAALLSQLTLLPALLLMVGRPVFWPFIPRFGTTGTDAEHGMWHRIGDWIAIRPRKVWITTSVLLVIGAGGIANLTTNLDQSDTFLDTPESVVGQQLIAKAFPQGVSVPTDVLASSPATADAVAKAAESVDGIAEVVPTDVSGDEGVLLRAALTEDPYSSDAFQVIDRLRDAVQKVDPKAEVGGETAIQRDFKRASDRDTKLLVPVILTIVFLILLILLRSIVAPILLIATVALSFAAALGVSAVVFDVLFGFNGSDSGLLLFGFVFLVALGVDYNIFLMARVREEAAIHGTRKGMLRGLAVTGGVITAAGIVLAGTFAVLGVLPLVFLAQLGFLVAFGVLLDTFVVRSILVPALVLDIGPKVWWPSALADDPALSGAETTTNAKESAV
jgi:RND superfamily putative drug exporter